MEFIRKNLLSCRKSRGNIISRKHRKAKICCVFCASLLALIFSFVFIGFPLLFMNLENLQRMLIFTRFNLPHDRSYFENFNLTGFRNLYVPITQYYGGSNIIHLGVWHLLPHNLINESIIDKNFDYDLALKRSNFSVLLYFHGTGEARSFFPNKYHVFRNFSHVIAFDYRSYADSTPAPLTELSVVHDCVQLYKWLLNRTESPIFVWGHSLGSALSARTVALLGREQIVPKGLFLESAFTKMSEELPVHPYGKLFAWLPWFKATILRPLERNGFIFNTAEHVANVTCPIMVMCAEDDPIVPYRFGHRLYEIARDRSLLDSFVLYYQLPFDRHYGHFYIYRDPDLPTVIKDFIDSCDKDGRTADSELMNVTAKYSR